MSDDEYDDQYDEDFDPVAAAMRPPKLPLPPIEEAPLLSKAEALTRLVDLHAHPKPSFNEQMKAISVALLDAQRASDKPDVIRAVDPPIIGIDMGARGYAIPSPLPMRRHVSQPIPAVPTAYDVDLSIIPKGRYTYVTGAAGTGKTTLMRAYRASLGTKAALCATTGIAAINLGDAVTVNSLLGYYNTAGLRDNYVQGFLQARLRKLRAAGTTRYILDEVSMLEAEQLELLISAFEDVNGESSVILGHEPAIGLTFVGDFLQLPPIGEKGGPPARYAFEADSWAEHLEPNILQLTEVKRQADPGFLRALAALRSGDPDPHALDELRPCLQRTQNDNFAGTTIFAKNEHVDRYNSLRQKRLTTKPELFVSIRTGTPKGEWRQIPETLLLKPGALVMILTNKTSEGEIVYANGDLGIFEGLLGEQESRIEAAGADGNGVPLPPGNRPIRTAVVRLHRTGQCVNVPPLLRQNEKPTGHKGKRKDAYEVIGEIRYLPLRVAYATTVHKSQGLTLDQVQLAIGDPFWQQPAMLYVGVSRTRTLEGLHIVGTLDQVRNRTVFDPRVARWR